MRPLNTLLTTFFLFLSSTLAFTTSASLGFLYGNSTQPISSGTGVPYGIGTDSSLICQSLNGTAPHGTGCASGIESTGTRSFLSSTAKNMGVVASLAIKKRLVHTPSGGLTSSSTANGTVVGPTGTGVTGTVSATGAVLLPDTSATV